MVANCPSLEYTRYHFSSLGSTTPKYVKFGTRKSLPCSHSTVSFSVICSSFLIISSGWKILETIREHVWLHREHIVLSINAVALGFHLCSLGNVLTFTGTHILVHFRVLISNLRSILEAQFDSQVRATGHSYEKYNNWETVGHVHCLVRHYFGNWTTNATLIHMVSFVDRGLDSASCQWESRPHLSQFNRHHIWRTHYVSSQGNCF